MAPSRNLVYIYIQVGYIGFIYRLDILTTKLRYLYFEHNS